MWLGETCNWGKPLSVARSRVFRNKDFSLFLRCTCIPWHGFLHSTWFSNIFSNFWLPLVLLYLQWLILLASLEVHNTQQKQSLQNWQRNYTKFWEVQKRFWHYFDCCECKRNLRQEDDSFGRRSLWQTFFFVRFVNLKARSDTKVTSMQLLMQNVVWAQAPQWEQENEETKPRPPVNLYL